VLPTASMCFCRVPALDHIAGMPRQLMPDVVSRRRLVGPHVENELLAIDHDRALA